MMSGHPERVDPEGLLEKCFHLAISDVSSSVKNSKTYSTSSVVIAISGIPGSGKTFLAKTLSSSLQKRLDEYCGARTKGRLRFRVETLSLDGFHIPLKDLATEEMVYFRGRQDTFSKKKFLESLIQLKTKMIPVEKNHVNHRDEEHEEEHEEHDEEEHEEEKVHDRNVVVSKIDWPTFDHHIGDPQENEIIIKNYNYTKPMANSTTAHNTTTFTKTTATKKDDENDQKYHHDRYIFIIEGLYILNWVQSKLIPTYLPQTTKTNVSSTQKKIIDLMVYLEANLSDKWLNALIERNTGIPGYTADQIKERVIKVDKQNALTVMKAKQVADLIVKGYFDEE
eukprot:g1738.t1